MRSDFNANEPLAKIYFYFPPNISEHLHYNSIIVVLMLFYKLTVLTLNVS